MSMCREWKYIGDVKDKQGKGGEVTDKLKRQCANSE
jgi:hypothetical protein